MATETKAEAPHQGGAPPASAPPSENKGEAPNGGERRRSGSRERKVPKQAALVVIPISSAVSIALASPQLEVCRIFDCAHAPMVQVPTTSPITLSLARPRRRQWRQ